MPPPSPCRTRRYRHPEKHHAQICCPLLGSLFAAGRMRDGSRCPETTLRCLSAGRATVLPRAVRGFDEAGRTYLCRQLHDLDSDRREDASRRDRPSTRLRRGIVQVGSDGCLRSALAGAGEEARLCLAGSLLRATRKSRLPDVVRSAQWLGRRVSEVPGRSRHEVRPSGIARRCRGRCGDTAAAVTGPAEWCCCIRNVSPPRGCAPACRC